MLDVEGSPRCVSSFKCGTADLDYFESPSRIFKCIENGDFEAALSQLKESDDEAKKWVLRRDTDGTTTWRRLPIHEACIRCGKIRGNKEVSLIDALVQAYPNGVKDTDASGRLPLHHACIHGASEAVILKLLKANPESIEVKDKWDKTPLSIAEVSANHNKSQVYSMLLKGKEYYYKKAAEDVYKSTLKQEKEKFDAKVKIMEERSMIQIASIDSSSREDRDKYQNEVKELTEQFTMLACRHETAKKSYTDEVEELKLKLELCENEKDLMEKQFAEDNIFCDSFKEVMEKQKIMFEERIEKYKKELKTERETNDVLILSMASEIKNLTERKAFVEEENDKLKLSNSNYEEMKHVLRTIVSNLDSLRSNDDAILESVGKQRKEFASENVPELA